MRRRIFFNSLSGGLLFFVNVAVAFVMSPIIVKSLGNRAYGVWEILLSVFGYLAILDLGVNAAIIRYVARATAREDEENLERIVSSAFFILAVTGLLGFAVLNGVALFPQVLNLKPHASGEIRAVALFLGINFLAQFSGTVFAGYLMGFQRHLFLNGVKMAMAVVQAVLTWLALTRWSGPGLVWLAGIVAGVNVVQYLVLAGRVLAGNAALRRAFLHITFSWSTLRELYAFGLKSVTLMVSSRITGQSIPIVIGWVLGAGQVVFYVIPGRLADYASGLALAVGLPLMPYFSSLDGRGDRRATVRAWYGLSSSLQFVMLGLALAMLTLGVPFIARWMGPSYAESGRWVVRFLGATMLLEAVSPNSGRLLIGMNKHGLPARISVFIAVAGLPVTILLAHLFGLAGVAASVFVVRGVNIAVWLVLASQALGIDPLYHIRRTYVPFFPALLVGGLLILTLNRFHPPVDYGSILLNGLAGATAYVAGSWFLALKGTERNAILGFLSELRGRGLSAGAP